MSKVRNARTRESQTGTKLWWSNDGRIACIEHAPYPGSDTWVTGQWEPVPEGIIGHPMVQECESCASTRRNARKGKP